MHYKIPENRNQIMLFPQLDLWIDQNNAVRLIDLIVDKIILENPSEFQWKGQSKKGCTSYSPSTMSKLLLYCYFNWISGSRRMEKETYRNMELIWLLGNLHPDHWTICEFRRENKVQIKFIAVKFRKFLKDSGYIDGKTIVIDGCKMKAYASSDMFSEESIAKRLEKIDQQIANFLNASEEIDNLESQLEEEKEEKQELLKKIEKLESKKKRLEKIKKQLKETGKKYISPNDPDASLMKGRDGKKACYNVQSGMDSKHKMIAYVEASTDANDLQLLEPVYQGIVEEHEFEPEELEADKGYYNTKHIKKIEDNTNTTCYVPVPQPPKRKEDIISSADFKYDEENDELICPENKRLKLCAKNKEHSSQLYNQYQCFDCHKCPIKNKCTRSKYGRTVKRNIHSTWIDEYKLRLKNKHAKEKIAERKTIVEHPFGTLKLMMGKHCFLLTKKHKVQVELDLYSTAYNLKRLINIENFGYMVRKIEKYDWKVS